MKPRKYNFYLRQGITKSYNNIKNQLSLKIFVEANNNSNQENMIYESKLMDEKMFQELRNQKELYDDENEVNWENKYLYEIKSGEDILKDNYITTIDLPKFTFDENEDFKVILKFMHLDMDGKYGWFIDGAILHRIE